MPVTVPPPALPPAAAIDFEAVHAAAARLMPLGAPVADHGRKATLAWRQVGDHYRAPETPVLLGALDKVAPLAATSGRQVAGLGTALDVFADMAEPLVLQLRRLAAADRVTLEEAAEMAALAARLAVVEQACATAIRSHIAASLEPDKIKVAERVEKDDGGLSAGVATLEGGVTFKVTRSSDETVSVTALSATNPGLAGSVGGLLDLGGGVTLEHGSTWRFQDAAEADRMLGELRRYVDQRQRPVAAGKGGFPAGALVRPPRPPDAIVTEIGAKVSGGGKVDVGAFQGSAKGEGALKETLTRDLATGTTTSALGVEGSLAADGTVRPFGVGPGGGPADKGTIALTREVTRDPEGRITDVQLTETRTDTHGSSVDAKGPRDASGGRHRAPGVHPGGKGALEHKEAESTVVTTGLKVTDANRALVEEWVARGRPDIGTPAGRAKLHRPDTAVPGDAFQNLLHREATVSEVTYAETTERGGVEGEVKAGAKVGGKLGSEVTTSRAVRASHLDASGPDGVRRSVPDPEQVGR